MISESPLTSVSADYQSSDDHLFSQSQNLSAAPFLFWVQILIFCIIFNKNIIEDIQNTHNNENTTVKKH